MSENVILRGKVNIGKNVTIQDNVIIGHLENGETWIGDNSVIRSGTIIYSSVKIGENFKTGHNVLVRENTIIGNNVLLGTGSIVENNCKLGNNISIQSDVYIPTNTVVCDNVFIGPRACLTNDRYPLRIKADLKGPTVGKGATIGANATILSSVDIGEGAFVAAGAVLTKNIQPWKLAVGVPAKILDLPEKLKKLNVR